VSDLFSVARFYIHQVAKKLQVSEQARGSSAYRKLPAYRGGLELGDFGPDPSSPSPRNRLPLHFLDRPLALNNKRRPAVHINGNLRCFETFEHVSVGNPRIVVVIRSAGYYILINI
jgi:hypothetical protein